MSGGGWRTLKEALREEYSGNWQRALASDVEAAFEHAVRLLPNEPRFAEELAQFRDRQRERNHLPPRSLRNGRRSTPRQRDVLT